MVPFDTTREAERVRIDLLRRLPIARRLALAGGLMAFGRTLAMIGLRQRHPEATPEELETRYVRMVLGPELAGRVLAARRARAARVRDGGRDGARPV